MCVFCYNILGKGAGRTVCVFCYNNERKVQGMLSVYSHEWRAKISIQAGA